MTHGNFSTLCLTSVVHVFAVLPFFTFRLAFVFATNSSEIGLFVQKTSIVTVFHTKYYVQMNNSAKILEKKTEILYNVYNDSRRTSL